jgi:hypothetical protein
LDENLQDKPKGYPDNSEAMNKSMSTEKNQESEYP